MHPQTQEASLDLSFDYTSALVHTSWLTIVLIALVVLPHAVIYGENPFSGLYARFGAAAITGVMVASIVIHELLHAIAVVMFGGLRKDDVSFGVNWKVLMPYAHPKKPVTARAYLITVAAPGVVLGVIPSVTGLFTGDGAWTVYGALMLAGASGDLMIAFSLRRVPASVQVQDHPSRVGCYVPATPAR